jgi:hypothetical protein
MNVIQDERNSLKKWWLLAITTVLIVVLLVPYECTVVPAWRIRVVDESGELVRGVTVRQHWQHYAVEDYGHEAELQTDENGYVVFPQRTIKTNGFSLVFGSLGNILENPIHGDGFLPDAHVVVFGWDRGYVDGGTWYSIFSPMPSQIVVRRRVR